MIRIHCAFVLLALVGLLALYPTTPASFLGVSASPIGCTVSPCSVSTLGVSQYVDTTSNNFIASPHGNFFAVINAGVLCVYRGARFGSVGNYSIWCDTPPVNNNFVATYAIVGSDGNFCVHDGTPNAAATLATQGINTRCFGQTNTTRVVQLQDNGKLCAYATVANATAQVLPIWCSTGPSFTTNTQRASCSAATTITPSTIQSCSTTFLMANDYLGQNNYMVSENRAYYAIFMPNGNICSYAASSIGINPIQCNNPNSGQIFVQQSDGNLCEYSSFGSAALYCFFTVGAIPTLVQTVVTDTGLLCQYNNTNDYLTNKPPLLCERDICTAGSAFHSNYGTRFCEPCPANFTSLQGTNTCTACPNGYTSTAGSATCLSNGVASSTASSLVGISSSTGGGGGASSTGTSTGSNPAMKGSRLSLVAVYLSVLLSVILLKNILVF